MSDPREAMSRLLHHVDPSLSTVLDTVLQGEKEEEEEAQIAALTPASARFISCARRDSRGRAAQWRMVSQEGRLLFALADRKPNSAVPPSSSRVTDVTEFILETKKRHLTP